MHPLVISWIQKYPGGSDIQNRDFTDAGTHAKRKPASPHKAEGKVKKRGIGRSIGLGKGTGKEPGKGPGRGGGKGGEGNDKNWYNKLTDYRKYYIQIQAIQSFKPSYIRLG